MTRKTCTAAIFLAAIIGSTALGIDGADAVKMRMCPDGTWVSDSQICPKFKDRKKGKTLAVDRIGLEAATFPRLDLLPKPRRIPQKRLD